MRKILATSLVLFFSLGLAMFSPAVAFAGDAASVARQVESLSAQGAERFRAGDYEAAIAFFEEAYGLEPVPNLLYNIGRCYEQLEKWDEAIAHFERFITAPDVESDAREHAMQRVQSLREIRAATAQKDDDLVDEPIDDEPVVAASQPNMVPGFAAVGAGTALIAGGVVTGVMARSNAMRISDNSLSYNDRLAARDTARTQGIVADVLFVSGAAAAAVGVYLILSSRSADDQPALAVQPWLGRDSAGVGVHLGF